VFAFVVAVSALVGCKSFPFELGADPATDTMTLAHITCNMHTDFITIGARDIFIKPGNRKLAFQDQNENAAGRLDKNYALEDDYIQ
jgi:hypothetical protein